MNGWDIAPWIYSNCLPKDVWDWCAWAESLGYNPEITRNLLEVNKKWITAQLGQTETRQLITDNEIPRSEEEVDQTVHQETADSQI